MANLRQIRRHINSVQSIAKTTSAMEVVSTAKNLRIESRVANARLFAATSWELLTHLAWADEEAVRANPLFCGYDQIDSVGMILITSNKGLVGSYNHNLLAQALRVVEHRPAVKAITLGRQGQLAMLRRGVPIHADVHLPEERVELDDLAPVAQIAIEGMNQRQFDEVVLIHTLYHEGARLQVTTRRLLPVCPEAPTERRNYVYEPEPEELFRSLLPRVIRFQLFEAYMESLVAENVSRMVAMRAATQNADDVIKDLTLAYNKARQQAITAEMADLLGERAGRASSILGGLGHDDTDAPTR